MSKRLATLAFCAAVPVLWSAQTNGAAPTADISTALTKLDTYMRYAMNRTGVPGSAVAVVYQDQVVFLRGYGVLKAGERFPVNPDTVFEVASLSKPISSTILASLVGTGDVKWDDRIGELDPEFKLSDPAASEEVTIRDFFAHRSGLPTGGGDLLEDLGYTRPEILYRLKFVPLAGEFRKTYHYSNFGITEGAVAAAKKVGRPWEQIADERLYERLGMSSTSSRFSDYENNPNKAALHFATDCDANNHCVFKNRFVREADAEGPAGGVSSSVRDLAKWLRLQLAGGSFNGQQIVSWEALEETHKAEICKSVPGPVSLRDCPGKSYYGLGWNVGTTAWGKPMSSHSGAFLLGTGTTVFMVPSEQIGIVVLGNSTPVGLPEAAALTFLDYFHYGYAKRDWLTTVTPDFVALRKEAQNSSTNYSELKPPQSPIPAKPLSAYTGKYFNQLYGTLEVHAEGGQLILRLPPRGSYYELKHWNGDTFTYYFASENTGVARRGVKLSGKQVLIENLAIENSGIFTKVRDDR